MIAQIKTTSLTPEEYLAWEETQEIRHEYINGEVYAMAGGTIPHNDLALNVYTALRGHIKARGCRINVNDVKVKLKRSRAYFYPDVVVSCHEQDRRSRDFMTAPLLIIEVLSPTTAAYDRGDKFKHYRSLPSLMEYVLVDAEKVGIDVYRRLENGKWELTSYPEEMGEDGESDQPNHPNNLAVVLASMLELTSIDFKCPLAAIYEDVELGIL